jgi:DNA primase
MLLDNDEAGETGRKNALNKFGHLANIRNFYIQDGYKDIDEYITKEKIGSYEEMSFVVKS